MPFDFSFTSVTRWFCKQNTLIDYYELSGEKDIFFKNVGSVNSTDTLVISNRETMTKWVPGLNPPPPRQWPRKQFSILSSHPTLQTPLPHHCQIVILPLTILRHPGLFSTKASHCLAPIWQSSSEKWKVGQYSAESAKCSIINVVFLFRKSERYDC